MLTRPLEHYAWTWQDQIRPSARYHKSFFEADVLGRFLERVKGVSLADLGVEQA